MLQFSSAPNWETFPAYLIVLDNLRDVFGSSKKTDFMLVMFEVSKVFGCRVTNFNRFTNFLLLFFKND